MGGDAVAASWPRAPASEGDQLIAPSIEKAFIHLKSNSSYCSSPCVLPIGLFPLQRF